jgi:uncharacterized protein
VSCENEGRPGLKRAVLAFHYRLLTLSSTDGTASRSVKGGTTPNEKSRLSGPRSTGMPDAGASCRAPATRRGCLPVWLVPGAVAQDWFRVACVYTRCGRRHKRSIVRMFIRVLKFYQYPTDIATCERRLQPLIYEDIVTSTPIKFFKDPNDVKLPPIPQSLVNDANALYVSLNQPGRELGEQLKLVYTYLDKFGPYVGTFASCSKGCSHCCSIDVQLTTLEAEYIQVHTGVPLRAGGELTTGHRAPCPFLTGAGGCGIYEHRPVVCRTFHALGDPKNCQPGRSQIQYGAPPQYGNDIFANLIGWVHHVTVHANGTCKDIRDFFPHPRAQVQSFLSRQDG